MGWMIMPEKNQRSLAVTIPIEQVERAILIIRGHKDAVGRVLVELFRHQRIRQQGNGVTQTVPMRTLCLCDGSTASSLSF